MPRGVRRKLEGRRFGHLTVLNRHSVGAKGSVRWLCRCDCGNETVVFATALGRKVRGTSSCGKCGFIKIAASAARIKHGHASGGKMTRLYQIWVTMKSRAYRKVKTHIKNYEFINIDYEPWISSFESFRDWAAVSGYKDNLEIDRIDNHKGYSPDNCRWATDKEQANNRSNNVFLTGFGETKTAAQWADDPRSRVDAQTMRNRKKAGWDEWDAICVPSRKEVTYY